MDEKLLEFKYEDLESAMEALLQLAEDGSPEAMEAMVAGVRRLRDIFAKLAADNPDQVITVFGMGPTGFIVPNNAICERGV